jgi:hypothetical protein
MSLIFCLLARPKTIFTLTTSLALFLSAATFSHSTTVASAAVVGTSVVEATSSATSFVATEQETNAQPAEQIISVQQYVKNYFSKTPILARIAKCESQYRQYTTNGDLLRGREVREDVGVMQINETYHKAVSAKLGYNIYSMEGNLAYGKYLYDHQGTAPWSASAPCWDK